MTTGDPRSDGSRWPTILLIVGAGIVSAFQVGKAPTALAAVQAEFALGLAMTSWSLSAFAIVGALAGIPIGVAVDHVGARGWRSVASCCRGRWRNRRDHGRQRR